MYRSENFVLTIIAFAGGDHGKVKSYRPHWTNKVDSVAVLRSELS
jgi:hypothetical protein